MRKITENAENYGKRGKLWKTRKITENAENSGEFIKFGGENFQSVSIFSVS
jgi:hypothetical protein